MVSFQAGLRASGKSSTAITRPTRWSTARKSSKEIVTPRAGYGVTVACGSAEGAALGSAVAAGAGSAETVGTGSIVTVGRGTSGSGCGDAVAAGGAVVARGETVVVGC